MGKKRIAKKEEGTAAEGAKAHGASKTPKKKVTSGVLYVESTYNNTRAAFTDTAGNVLVWSSSGSLGFKGAKKGTPFAASKVGDLVGEKAQALGAKEAAVVVKGTGSGRESTVRAFAARGIDLTSIKDMTPVPHNGPQPKKPRKI
ncbi:MAG: 30S ribosomal protein S11 [bacterium]|nr:30S ribosomal protein S11 [bacterium]